MKNKIYMLLLLLIVVISCDKKNSIDDVLITNPDEAWVYYNPNSTEFIYFKFDKNHFSNRYERDATKKFYKYNGEGDILEVSNKWSVSQDSILRWGMFVYDIASYNENVIVLYYGKKNTQNAGIIYLIKEKENSPRKFSSLYEEKRVKYPEKYKVDPGYYYPYR